jgi:hypothetical protein
MKALLLVIAAILTSCGSEISDFHHFTGNPDGYEKKVSLGPYAPYVRLFSQYAEEYDAPVKIDDLEFKTADIKDEGIMGRCHTYDHGTPTIVIDTIYWEKISPTQRIALVFHELGHCILKREHIEEGLSIMNPYLISDYNFSNHFDGLLSELFDLAKRNDW